MAFGTRDASIPGMTPASFVTAYGPRIARDYASLPHTPMAPDVQRAYDVFVTELKAQWDTLQGLTTLEPTTNGHIYSTSKALFTDIASGHLFYFIGGSLPQGHALRGPAGHGATLNEAFRAVHDFYGHYPGRDSFSALGEEMAFRRHARMFSYEAIKALATETRGQNSWFNFGPHAHEPRARRPFADQKSGLLPCYAWKPF